MTAEVTPEPAFRVDAVKNGEGSLDLRFEGSLLFGEAAALWRIVREELARVGRVPSVVFDLSRVDAVDGGSIALLVQLERELKQGGSAAEFTGAQGAVERILELYRAGSPPAEEPKEQAGVLARIGARTVEAAEAAKAALAFLGSLVVEVIEVARAPRTANWKDIAPLMNRTGSDAVPIVVVVNFLIGFVMAFQSAAQLKQFGANIYVADLVGISITRELGPLMTAILVCGRSGAAYAAELGTMKVSEEIDALRATGFGPLRFLVIPRVMALMLVAPLLTIIADVVALFGGLLVGITSLDLTLTAYLIQTRKAVEVWDVGQGMLKSVVFAAAVAAIACQQGLATTGGAAGVGRRTTSAVVTGLLALVLIDAVFTVVFRSFGI
jgi:phospholipid/cholesterol/gamma-HCH transport system permease protein